MMKHLVRFLALSAALAAASPVAAHPGLTKANGCHTRKDGTDYHCHKVDAEKDASQSSSSADGETADASDDAKLPTTRLSKEVVAKLRKRAKEKGWEVEVDGDGTLGFRRAHFDVTARVVDVESALLKDAFVRSAGYTELEAHKMTAFGEEYPLYLFDAGAGARTALVTLPAVDKNVHLMAVFTEDKQQSSIFALEQLVNPAMVDAHEQVVEQEVQAFEEAAKPKAVTEFAGVKWGASKADVRAKRSKPRKDKEGRWNHVYGYKESLFGKESSVYFVFVEDQMVRGIYFIGAYENYADKNDYLSDASTVRDALIEKYGPPQSDDIEWNNSLYKDSPSEYGRAVARGHLERRTIWEEKGVRIMLLLTGENGEVSVSIRYVHEKLVEKEDDAREAWKKAQREADLEKL